MVTAGYRYINLKLEVVKVISCMCYSLMLQTYAATREDKNEFFDMLQHALSEVPSDERFVVLGDSNARVGSRVGEGGGI